MEEFLKRSLKRLLEEIHNAQQREDYNAADGFRKPVMESHQLAKTLFPDNKILQNISKEVPVAVPDPSFGNAWASPNLMATKLRVLEIIDAIGWDFSEINKITSSTPIFNITQTQSTLQYNIQAIDNILASLNQLSLNNENRLQLEQLIREFENESKKPKPDQSKLKEIAKKAGSLSKEVGLMLLQFALDKGLLAWAGLL